MNVPGIRAVRPDDKKSGGNVVPVVRDAFYQIISRATICKVQEGIVIDHASFQSFVQLATRSIANIAGKTRGEHTREDVVGELWITAADIEARKGFKIDFADPVHQELILSYTYQRLVHYCEKLVRTSTRLDHGYADDKPALHEKVADREGDAPLDFLIREQQENAEQERLASLGISVGTVWLGMLDRCGGRMVRMARFLKLSLSHSYRCYQKVQWLTATQIPLPLRMHDQTVATVKPWRPYRLYRAPEQLWFDFDPSLDLD